MLGGPPYSITIHGPEEFDRPHALSLAEKIRQAAFIVAISRFTTSQLFRWCDVAHWPKIHLIRCGLDPVFLQAAKVPIGAAPRFVNIGRLCEQKGQLSLIEAAAQLRDRGFDFELVLVGDGPMRPMIEAAIRRLDLADRVRLMGFLSNEEVRREILAARALVLPSFAEGLPVAIMESLALGRPAITTYIAGIPELIKDGVNGWLVPASSIEALADAMAVVLGTELPALEQMGRIGADDVNEQHDVYRESAKLARLIAAHERDSRNSDHSSLQAERPVTTTA
jgi:glycosyltransferase involved in cell wall biosynthesis